MSKKILILSGSPRKGGNSDYLCDKFSEGAKDAGHNVEKIFVSEKKSATAAPAMLVEIPTNALSKTTWRKSSTK